MLVSSAFPLVNATTWACPLIQNPIPISSQLDREFTRKRFEDLGSQELGAKQKAQVFHPIHQHWEEIHIDSVKIFQKFEFTDSHISQFLMAGMDLDRVAGLTSLFPSLKGEELFNEIWKIGQNPEGELEAAKNDEDGGCLTDPTKPFFLSIIASYDPNGYLSPWSSVNTRFRHQISKVYNHCTKGITSIQEFCETINEARKKNPIKVFSFHGHGKPESIDLTRKVDMSTAEDFYPYPCLQSLTPNDTIVILDSCSTGKGREFEYNMANFISNTAPPGVKLFAPDEPVQLKDFLTLSPTDLDLRFRNTQRGVERYAKDITYKIDPQDKEKHCPPGKISMLAFCNKKPLFKKKLGEWLIGARTWNNHLQFYNSLNDTWKTVSNTAKDYFWKKGFSNVEMGKISDAGIDLDEFITLAKEHSAELSPAEVTDKVIAQRGS